MSIERMESFLKQQRLAGQLADEGSFTLDYDLMLEKMAVYQIQEPALYFLKAVQAAVCFGAERVDIRLGRGTVEVSFAPLRDEGISLRNLLVATEGENPAAWHLGSMLLLALSTGPREVRLEWCSGGREQRWSLTAGFEEIAGDRPQGNLCRLFLERRVVGLLERIIPLAAMLQIQSTLRERCAFCPIPVLLDGRPVTHPVPESHPEIRSRLPLLAQMGRQPAWAAEKIWLRTERPHFGLASYWSRRPGMVRLADRVYPLNGPCFEGQHSSRFSVLEGLPPGQILERDEVGIYDRLGFLGYQTVHDHLTRVDGSETVREKRSALCFWQGPVGARQEYSAERWLGLRDGASGKTGRLIYVKAGVCLDPIEGPVGSCCLWARDDVPTDLGHLQVRRESSVETDLAWLGEQQAVLAADPALKGSLRDLERFRPDFRALWNRKYSLELKKDSLVLGKAWDLFALPDTFDDLVTLRMDGERQSLVVDSGPCSLCPVYDLAPLSEVRRVSLEWVEYLHERDHPAEDEEAIQIRLEVRLDRRFLRFDAGRYAKFRFPFTYAQLSEWCRVLATASGAKLVTERGSERIW